MSADACFTDWRELAQHAELADAVLRRCVYTGDNDVVDHQVVELDYANGVTATHTVTAFTEMAYRQTRIFGTHGSIEGDGQHVTLHDFRAHPARTISTFDTTTDSADVAVTGAVEPGVVTHSDGDHAAVAAFLTAVTTGDSSHIRSGPRESLDSHRAVWAAERSRRTNTTVTLSAVAAGTDRSGR